MAHPRKTIGEASPLMPTGGVMVATGYGIRIGVERGHLIVEDGVGASRRCGRFSRVSAGFNRLVVIGHTGTVTLDALRWLHDIGAAFVHIDTDSDLIAVGGPTGVRDARVCRGQARAGDTGSALIVARGLLAAKVSGQATVSERLPDGDQLSPYVHGLAARIEAAPSIATVCYAESEAAVSYWRSWSTVATSFIPRQQTRVPAHWVRFGQRQSPLSRKQSKAINPANALLNYLYAILEAETRLALLAVGCDPSMGVIHADRMSRDSFALDVMEPVRPHVDAFVLDLLATQQFARDDFFETRDGWCKLMPSLTRPLATTAPNWRALVAPFAEWAATIFAKSGDHSYNKGQQIGRSRPPGKRSPLVRTPLSHDNLRLSTRGGHRPSTLIASPPVSSLPARCRSCGVKLTSRRRKYCDVCIAIVGTKDRAEGVKHASARRKAAGIRDRRSASEVLNKRWSTLAAREAEHRVWEDEHGTGPVRDVFLTQITPTLEAVPVDVLITATGLSRPMCYRIRRGRSVPHWRHWEAIRHAVASYRPPALRDWEQLSSDTYTRIIAPVIASIPTKQIRAATGFSEAYVSLVKRGHYVPHRRHWRALLAVIESITPREPSRVGVTIPRAQP